MSKKVGILINKHHPTGWKNCDWTNRMQDASQNLGFEVELVDSHSGISDDALFYLTRLNHDAGQKNTEELSKKLSSIANEFEKRGSLLYPTSFWYSLYENKKNIALLFKRCGVKHPTTHYFTNLDDALSAQIKFPVVIKHPYSCASNFMSQAYSKQEYKAAVTKIISRFGECVVQQKILFTKEARITYVGDKAIHGYFRIKKDSKSLSGSTRFGSICDFNIDLEKMSKFISSFRKKTNISIAAVDVAWDNDDTSTEPYFFEVSPIFSMNVPGPVGSAYKSFKGTVDFKRIEKEIQTDYYTKVIEHLTDKLSKPKIYCDIDYTINNHTSRCKKWFLQDPNKFGSHEEVMKDPPRDEARNILNSLKDKFNVVFLTARSNLQTPYESTRDWLIENNFHYDKIVIVKNFEEKLSILKNEKNLHLFIDDLTRGHHEKHITVCKDKVKKLYYHNIPFVRFDNNWKEIGENYFDSSK